MAQGEAPALEAFPQIHSIRGGDTYYLHIRLLPWMLPAFSVLFVGAV